MLFEIPRLVLGYQIVKGSRHERKVSIVVVCNCFGQRLVSQRNEMLEIDIEGGKVVNAQAVNLRNVVFVRRQSA